MGPIAMARQLERIEEYMRTGVEEGARIATGGGRPAGMDLGYFFQPTLFVDVDNQSRIAREEIFGPVGCVIAYDDVHDAIRLANQTDFGLDAILPYRETKTLVLDGRPTMTARESERRPEPVGGLI